MPHELLSTEKLQFLARPLDQYQKIKWPVCLVWRAALAEKTHHLGKSGSPYLCWQLLINFCVQKNLLLLETLRRVVSFCKGQLKLVWFFISGTLNTSCRIQNMDFKDPFSLIICIPPPHHNSAFISYPRLRGVVKKRIFYGQADCKRWPHPPYSQLFVICFGVCKIGSKSNGLSPFKWVKMFTFAYGQGRGGRP